MKYKAKDFQINDRFKIVNSPFSKELFRVIAVSQDSVTVINEAWETDVEHTITDTNFDYWGAKVQIVSRASGDDAINRVSVRLSGESLAKGEKGFAKVQKALEKAVIEFRENTTIRFENGRLSFVSRESGKTRNVTKNGCWFECSCQNQFSYHRALYLICEEAAKGVPLPKAAPVQDSELFEKVAA